ncbi:MULTISPECIES: DUF3013 family protein [unclassified Enterococcus]|uniref:DUF3013 family protein n=1 Tax=unclassified Enterococcus TaxID=2608891 RepID=UPI001556EB9B|nr:MULTISPECIES: DUF3013 family protein [unclassified Enterococcus]MBS7578196.1 DUF3013 family protein [Enterococcus sp. MMGLQ5-2]MBS7585428.1 DUF3013 family protein [Enterococcus sp. MMGLQ5-1]NPD13285.1 DUF3013 family protein [Enterococcus sp. MMGLQ5-1]NPD38027.1 DUF3013 family protein [Enterococcus sp. MMGLQ5-2]
MAKINFVEVLETLFEQELPNDFEFIWDKKNFTIALCFIIDVHNPKHIELIDIDGAESADNIAYEDAILFYHPIKSKFDPKEYLAAFPYQDKKGLSKEFLVALIAHLKFVLSEGESDLMDFLTDDLQDVFELNFHQADFQQKIENIEETEFFAYPKY